MRYFDFDLLFRCDEGFLISCVKSENFKNTKELLFYKKNGQVIDVNMGKKLRLLKSKIFLRDLEDYINYLEYIQKKRTKNVIPFEKYKKNCFKQKP